MVIRYATLSHSINKNKSNRSREYLVVIYPTVCLISQIDLRECSPICRGDFSIN
jgi:hypothetical protein